MKPARRDGGGGGGGAAVGILVVLAIGLCGLCVFQWTRETALRQRVQASEAALLKVRAEHAAVEAQGIRFQEELRRVEREREGLVRGTETNRALALQLREGLSRATNELATARGQLEAYRVALAQMNTNAQLANARIEALNAELGRVARERNEAVSLINEVNAKRETELKRYNDLVDRWNQQQEALKKASANAPK